MNLLPGPASILQASGQSHASQLRAPVHLRPPLHVGVIWLRHIERLGGVLLRVAHVLAPLDKLVPGHCVYRSCAKYADFSGAVGHKRYKSASLREKFGTQRGDYPAFLRRAAP